MEVFACRVAGAILLIAAPCTVSAETRRAASKGKTAVEFVDSDSVSRLEDKVTFRSQSIPSTPMAGGVNRIVQTKQVDCAAWTMQSLDAVYYDGGTVVLRDPAAAAKGIAANSVAESIAQTICGRRDYLSAPLPDPAAYAADHFEMVRASGE